MKIQYFCQWCEKACVRLAYTKNEPFEIGSKEDEVAKAYMLQHEENCFENPKWRRTYQEAVIDANRLLDESGIRKFCQTVCRGRCCHNCKTEGKQCAARLTCVAYTCGRVSNNCKTESQKNTIHKLHYYAVGASEILSKFTKRRMAFHGQNTWVFDIHKSRYNNTKLFRFHAKFPNFTEEDMENAKNIAINMFADE